MKNLTLVSTILAALVVTSPMTSPVLADEAYNQSVIASLQDNPSDAANIISDAIANICGGGSTCADEDAANELLADAIETIGADSPLIQQVLAAANNSGMNSDSITSVAVASGVDATVASESTAAGNDGTTTTTTTGNVTTNTGSVNNGGGGGGVSQS